MELLAKQTIDNNECVKITTETLDKYKLPRINKPKLTRKMYMNEILWNQISKEYFRKELEKNQNKETIALQQQTEYIANFNNLNCLQSPSTTVDETLILQYPLYGGNNAISFWNPIARNPTSFKQVHALTKLNEECLDVQWR